MYFKPEYKQLEIIGQISESIAEICFLCVFLKYNMKQPRISVKRKAGQIPVPCRRFSLTERTARRTYCLMKNVKIVLVMGRSAAVCWIYVKKPLFGEAFLYGKAIWEES